MTILQGVNILSPMEDQSWRKRLEEALVRSNRSARDVSLAMGRGPGYVHTLLRDEKNPTLPNLVSICEELRISTLWLLFGVDMDDDAEELLRIYSRLNADGRKEFLALVRSLNVLNKTTGT